MNQLLRRDGSNAVDTAFASAMGTETKQGLYEVTKNYAETFPAGQDITLDIRADVMSARKVGESKFVYRRFTHRGWKVKMHVFSDAEQKTIDDHGHRARRAAAMVKYLQRLRVSGGDHPRIDEVKQLLEKRRGAADKELEATAKLPLEALTKSLSIEHTPACKPSP